MANGKIQTRKELEEKIKEIFETDSISILISKQISKYSTEYEWSYLDIGRALFYFFNIKNGDKSKSTGIGIVPYVIDEARQYFKKLEEDIERQKQMVNDSKKQQKQVILCERPQQKKNRKKHIDLSQFREEDDDGE